MLYFFLARYFAFWARLVLNRWHPVIIAVSGSVGKTSTLEMLELLLKNHYSLTVSHKANSITGIPLNILGLKQKSFSTFEWIKLFLMAPMASTYKPQTQIYLCELDADRYLEMRYHLKLINPDITCLTNLTPCHTANYPGKNAEEILTLMAEEFGSLITHTEKVIIAPLDNVLLKPYLETTSKPVLTFSHIATGDACIRIGQYHIDLTGTSLRLNLNKEKTAAILRSLDIDSQVLSIYPETIDLSLPLVILPQSALNNIAITIFISLLFNLPFPTLMESFQQFRLPPGRMTLFPGIKATTLIDSTYNASAVAVVEALEILNLLGGSKNLAVLGDMRELGTLEEQEHIVVAKKIEQLHIAKIILVGPVMNRYVYPYLVKTGIYSQKSLISVLTPREALCIIKANSFIQPGDTILIKGSQNTLFLEKIVEELLASSKDRNYLCRRELLWEQKRALLYS